jgi:NAD(P)-dependent dehydrogenase (short-subunit alcohol dehydrogenase family)
MKLANKVALIAGGAQGLGKAIALAMANEGPRWSTAPLKGEPTRKRSTMSAEGRARIAAAQRKRWAKAQRK